VIDVWRRHLTQTEQEELQRLPMIAPEQFP
jgi:hypothetical protein